MVKMSNEHVKTYEEKHFLKDEVLLILYLIQKQVERLK